MTTRPAVQMTSLAGHRFHVSVDADFADVQLPYLLDFKPQHGPATLCGKSTKVRVLCDGAQYADAMDRIRAERCTTVTPFRGEPYLSCQVDDLVWWRPDPAAGLNQDHLYAKDSAGQLRVMLLPEADRGERYLLRVIREVALRCAEERGWVVFHAAAAAIGDQGILIAGPTGAGKTTVLAALAATAGADVIAAERACLCPDGAVVGLPLSVRIAKGTASAIGTEVLPLPAVEGAKASVTPRRFAEAFGTRLRETAAARLMVLPMINAGSDIHVLEEHSDQGVTALMHTCCTPFDEDWLSPWFAERHREPDDLAHAASCLIARVVQTVPIVRLTVGTCAPSMLENIAETIRELL